MKKIDELLAVLDMTEEKQWAWLLNRCVEFWPDEEVFIGSQEKYLADLAFRLRDEVAKEDSGVLFGRGLAKICFKIYGGNNYNLNEFLSWSTVKAKPIHWIIAALIAKELAKDD